MKSSPSQADCENLIRTKWDDDDDVSTSASEDEWVDESDSQDESATSGTKSCATTLTQLAGGNNATAEVNFAHWSELSGNVTHSPTRWRTNVLCWNHEYKYATKLHRLW